MITTKTVFVLGAGASMPYGFPSGKRLVELIGGHGDDYGWLMSYGFQIDEIREFTKKLFDSDRSSIDAFLEHHDRFQLIGKTAIAYYLIASESHKPLFGGRNWYTTILDRMTGPSLDAFEANSVSFVTFNYDRSLEHYLFTALRNRYDTTDDHVKRVMSQIPIIHVHGRLGYLPWQDFAPGHERRVYNTVADKPAVEIAARGIKIISENLDDTPEFVQARELMDKAERIAFLGFGYHPRNMERLKIPSNKAIRGTSFGSTAAEIRALQRRYGSISLLVADLDCSTFFRNTIEFMTD